MKISHHICRWRFCSSFVSKFCLAFNKITCHSNLLYQKHIVSGGQNRPSGVGCHIFTSTSLNKSDFGLFYAIYVFAAQYIWPRPWGWFKKAVLDRTGIHTLKSHVLYAFGHVLNCGRCNMQSELVLYPYAQRNISTGVLKIIQFIYLLHVSRSEIHFHHHLKMRSYKIFIQLLPLSGRRGVSVAV